MSIFIDRKSELSAIESEYAKKGSGFVVIFGRRRVGKTTLIKEFIEKKPCIYFLADKQLETALVERLRNSIAVHLKDPFLMEIEFKSWDAVFDYRKLH